MAVFIAFSKNYLTCSGVAPLRDTKLSCKCCLISLPDQSLICVDYAVSFLFSRLRSKLLFIPQHPTCQFDDVGYDNTLAKFTGLNLKGKPRARDEKILKITIAISQNSFQFPYKANASLLLYVRGEFHMRKENEPAG